MEDRTRSLFGWRAVIPVAILAALVIVMTLPGDREMRNVAALTALALAAVGIVANRHVVRYLLAEMSLAAASAVTLLASALLTDAPLAVQHALVVLFVAFTAAYLVVMLLGLCTTHRERNRAGLG
jgi:drug/metabolite transporter (DMT)-like permease